MQDFEGFLGQDLRLFGVDDEFINKLKWMDRFVKTEVEPLDTFGFSPYDISHPVRACLFPRLQERVKQEGLWACHLGPELGGPGYGQFKLALMNIILGRSKCASKVFGTAAPDTGNAEILAHFGTADQKKKWLFPLIDDKISSCYSMTEPHGGADPLVFTTRATLDPATNEWVINGEKLWSSSAKYAAVFIVMCVTDPDASSPYQRSSIFIVPANTPGVQILRNIGVGLDEIDLHEAERGMAGGDHGYVRYTNVRVPFDHLLGARGGGFKVAQTRLSGGRIHYAMRTIGICKASLDMMCERVQSRYTQGSRLAEKQMTQEKIADSWMELEQFKLLVLRTAWLIDQNPKDYTSVRQDIASCKVLTPKVISSIVGKAMRLHGGMGVSWELPFVQRMMSGIIMGIADGPSEVHKITVARQVLKQYKGSRVPEEVNFTPYNLIALKKAALAKYGPTLEAAGVDKKYAMGGGFSRMFQSNL